MTVTSERTITNTNTEIYTQHSHTLEKQHQVKVVQVLHLVRPKNESEIHFHSWASQDEQLLSPGLPDSPNTIASP